MSAADLDLVMLLGSEVPDGYLVRDKDCIEIERELRLRNPTDRGHRFRRIAGSIPTIAGSPVKG